MSRSKEITVVVSAFIVLIILLPIVGLLFQPFNPNSFDTTLNMIFPLIILLIIIEFIRRFVR